MSDDFDSSLNPLQSFDEEIPNEILSISSFLPGIRERIQWLRENMSSPANDHLSPFQIQNLIGSLPRLTEKEVIQLGFEDASCPICLNSFLAILSEEEMAIAMDSPAHPIEQLGVTRLSEPWQCGHIFCRKDISTWILEAHASCPMCRRLFIQPSDTAAPSGPPLGEIVREMTDRVTLLQTSLQGILAPVSLANTTTRTVMSNAQGDADHPPGMYS